MAVKQSIQFIIDCLADHIIASNLHINRYYVLDGIRLVDSKTKVESGCVYFGEYREMHKILQGIHGPVDSLFCISGQFDDKIDFKDYCNYIVSDLPLTELFNRVAMAVQEYGQVSRNRNKICNEIKGIFSGRISDEQEILKIIGKAIENPRKRFNIAVAFFKEVPSEDVLRKCSMEVLDIFENSFSMMGKDMFVVIYTHDSRNTSFPSDTRKLIEEILDRNNAYIAISSDSSRYERLMEEYDVAMTIMSIVRNLDMFDEDRIFPHEEYGMYFVFELCSRQYKALFKNSETLYKGHPAIVTLREYDREHNTDLCDTLYQYLLNGMNISSTASALYAHRNTVHNKIKKIISIINDDLNDGKVRFNIFFAYMLLKYNDHYSSNDTK